MKPRLSMLAPMQPSRHALHFHRPSHTIPFLLSTQQQRPHTPPHSSASRPSHRLFTTTAPAKNWLQPRRNQPKYTQKGRPRLRTGGSSRGTTVVWGNWGLRLCDRHRRIPAKALALGADAIRKRLKGERYRLFTRVAANVAVYSKGNEVRMGKGKGSFDTWAARVSVSQIVFEVSGNCHEQVVRDAMRLAGHKLPGQWEFVKKGDPPVVGITKLTEGVTLESLRRPRKSTIADTRAGRIPATSKGPLPDPLAQAVVSSGGGGGPGDAPTVS